MIANFGTLSERSAMGHDDGDPEDRSGPSLWWVSFISIIRNIFKCLYRNGNVVEYKQDLIAKSKYHTQIEHDCEETSQDDEPEVRYWSDFNRLYHSPKTVQRLPDTADWENAEGNWQEGRDAFKRLDEVRVCVLIFSGCLS